MTNYYTVTISEVAGEPTVCSSGLALMFGVAPTDVTALPVNGGQARIPREWLQRGRRRTREAAAHTGSASFEDVLCYWARQDHDAELRVVYA